MKKYTKSERTARKAKKQARLDAAADVQQVQVEEQAATKARLEQLTLDYALLKKQTANRKTSESTII